MISLIAVNETVDHQGSYLKGQSVMCKVYIIILKPIRKIIISWHYVKPDSVIPAEVCIAQLFFDDVVIAQ